MGDSEPVLRIEGKPVLSRLRDSPWYRSATELAPHLTPNGSKSCVCEGEGGGERRSEEIELKCIGALESLGVKEEFDSEDKVGNVEITEYPVKPPPESDDTNQPLAHNQSTFETENVGADVPGFQEPHHTRDRGRSSDSGNSLNLRSGEASHPENMEEDMTQAPADGEGAELNSVGKQGAFSITVEESRKPEPPATSCTSVQEKGRSSRKDQDWTRRNSCGALKSTLSKSPISVIALSANSSQPGGFAETISTIRTQEPAHCQFFSKENEKQTVFSSNDKGQSPSDESKTEQASLEATGTVELNEPTSNKCERPTVRRRLSKTIQHLQEKLQQEIANNENRPYTQSQADAKAAEPKKLPGKTNSRFARERSRRRSKSRVAFKVFQCARKHHPANTRERPYRQWAGVGSCVTADKRYIVSSNTFREKMRSETETTTKAATDADKTAASANICLTDTIDIGEDSSSERDSLYQAKDALSKTIRSNEPSKSGEQKERCHPANVPAIDADDESLVSTTPSSYNPSKRSREQGVEGKDRLSMLNASSRLSSSSRERSRCIKRAPSGTDRQVRPPTPHSELPRRDVAVTKPPSLGAPRLRTASRARSVVTSAESSPRNISLGTLSDQPMETPVRKRQSLERRSPSMRVKGKRDNSSKSRQPFHGVMRSSKALISTGKRHRRTSNPGNPHGAAVPLHNGSGSRKPATGDSSPPCDGTGPLADGAASDVGSVETLWSDVSTTTYESSVVTEDGGSSVCRRRDVSDNHGDSSLHRWRKQVSGMGGAEGGFSRDHVTPNQLSKKYVDVQAVVDFKGSLPGQLSFRKGQIIKQMVNCPPGSEDEMSYGYFRVGRFKRKRKGLFPSTSVVPFKQ